MGLVDDVDAPLAAHDTAVLVALFQGLKRIDNLHAPIPRQGPEDRERAGRSQIRRADRQVCAARDLPISSQAASATDRHECPLLIQAQRGSRLAPRAERKICARGSRALDAEVAKIPSGT